MLLKLLFNSCINHLEANIFLKCFFNRKLKIIEKKFVDETLYKIQLKQQYLPPK